MDIQFFMKIKLVNNDLKIKNLNEQEKNKNIFKEEFKWGIKKILEIAHTTSNGIETNIFIKRQVNGD